MESGPDIINLLAKSLIYVKTLTKLKVIYTLGRRMTNDLPLQFDPVLFAQQGRSIAGQIEARELPGFSESASKSDGTIDVTMAFSTSSLKFPMVQGTIVGSIVQTCQRCLGDVAVEIDAPFKLLLVNPESLELASKEGHEIYEYSGQYVSTVEFIEDEILLTMPIVVKHQNIDQCDPEARKWMQKQEPLDVEVKTHKPNPFASLKNLKF